jgi:hypothetical protein
MSMGRIAVEVERASRELGLQTGRLSDAERDKTRRALEFKYSTGVRSWPLWESTRFPVAVQGASAWKWIGEFLGRRQGIILFNPSEEDVAFRIENGEALNLLLGETFGFEFYVSDDTLSFLFCFNHHDMLLAAGSAAGWLSGKAGSVQRDN